jgi:hypothetical protein
MLGATCLFTVCAACDKTQLSHTNTVDSGAQLKIIAAHFLFGRSAAAGIVFKILGQTHHSFGKFPNYCFLRAAAAAAAGSQPLSQQPTRGFRSQVVRELPSKNASCRPECINN